MTAIVYCYHAHKNLTIVYLTGTSPHPAIRWHSASPVAIWWPFVVRKAADQLFDVNLKLLQSPLFEIGLSGPFSSHAFQFFIVSEELGTSWSRWRTAWVDYDSISEILKFTLQASVWSIVDSCVGQIFNMNTRVRESIISEEMATRCGWGVKNKQISNWVRRDRVQSV